MTETAVQETQTTRYYNMHTSTEMIMGKRGKKTQAAVDAIRLITIMRDIMEENGLLDNQDLDDVSNVVCTLAPHLPKEAQEELRHG